MTDICLSFGSEEETYLEGLSEESLKSLIYINNDTILKDWESWKNYANSLHFRNFCFIETPCPNDPLHLLYFIINVDRVKDIIQENSQEFSEIGISISNFESELKNSRSNIWSKLLSNHYLMGLLHGYGRENSRHFLKVLNGEEQSTFPQEISNNHKSDDFPLPVYSCEANDSVQKKYEAERERIKKIYKNRDFLSVTMRRLQE